MNWSEVLRRNADMFPDKECVIGLGSRFTYRQLYDRASSLAQGMLALGLGKGDIVGILLYNCAEYMEITFAVNQIGAVWLPLNFRLVGPEIHYVLENAGA